MKKKILIVSIFAALILLSMPVISNIQAQETISSINKKSEQITQMESVLKLNGDDDDDDEGPGDFWCSFLAVGVVISGLLSLTILGVTITEWWALGLKGMAYALQGIGGLFIFGATLLGTFITQCLNENSDECVLCGIDG